MAVNQPIPKLPGVMIKDKDTLSSALNSKMLCQSEGTVRSGVTEQMSAALEKDAGALIHTCQSKSKACPAVSLTLTRSLGVSDLHPTFCPPYRRPGSRLCRGLTAVDWDSVPFPMNNVGMARIPIVHTSQGLQLVKAERTPSKAACRCNMIRTM